MSYPTVHELTTALCKDAAGELTFRPQELERLCARALEESDRSLFGVVAELLDFAAYLEVCQQAPKAAAVAFALLIWPLMEALEARARASGSDEERAEQLATRVRSEHKALNARHHLNDPLAPRPSTRAGIKLQSSQNPDNSGKNLKGKQNDQ